MNLFEDAEYGYRKAVELGDYQLDTWLFWVDVLVNLSEIDSAILTLLQASEYFPEEYEVEYRLAGLYYLLNEIEKGSFHLNNGLRLNFNNHSLLKELYPSVWSMKKVQSLISKHKQ